MRRSPLLVCLTILALFAAHAVLGENRCVVAQDSAGYSSPSSTNSEDGKTSVVADPYLVFVSSEAAHLRCGPSGEYYRTDPLRHGQELEVYVETADGWLGVRPINDSFCWIPADAAQLLSEPRTNRRGRSASPTGVVGKAEIIENKTVAWIGTNLGRARRYRWQVQLAEGEEVTILGSSERDGPDGPQTWYRIVPPSGEFRWVHRDQVVTTAEELVASIKQTSDSGSIEFLPGQRATSEADDVDRVASQDRNQSLTPTWETPRSLRPDAQSEPENRRSRLDVFAQSDRYEGFDSTDREPPRNDRQQDDQLIAASEPNRDHASHPKSFSQRVTDGIAALVRGRSADVDELQPMTSSSRRVPDLVPIAPSQTVDSIAQTSAVETQSASPVQESEPAQTDSNLVGSGIARTSESVSVGQLQQSPEVASVQHQAPAIEPSQSQVAISSRPRMVAAPAAGLANASNSPPSQPLGLASSNFAQSSPSRASTSMASPSAGQAWETRPIGAAAPQGLASSNEPLGVPTSQPNNSIQQVAGFGQPSGSGQVSLAGIAPPKMRSISSSQMAEVQRQVATADAGSLPSLLSTLMSRGASAPEMALVVEAAERLGLLAVAQRAREYQSLARRRDGDTIVRTASLSTPIIPAPMIGSSLPSGSLATSQITTHHPATMRSPSSGANFDQANVVVPGNPRPTQEGILVAVYSADPGRPPYALTDQGGRTLTYVTPAPGVDVQSHLGSQVRITGESGFLQGVETPHVIATAATRVLR